MFKLTIDEHASLTNFNTHILKFSFLSINILEFSDTDFKNKINKLLQEYDATSKILEKVACSIEKSTYHEYLIRIEGMRAMFIWLFEQVNYRKTLLEKILIYCKDSNRIVYVRPENLSERDIEILENKNCIETKSFTITHTTTSLEFYKNTHRSRILALLNFDANATELLYPYRTEIKDMYYLSLFLPQFNQDLLNYFIKYCLFNDLQSDIKNLLKKHSTFLIDLKVSTTEDLPYDYHLHQYSRF